jgi:NAD(P)-dependent dehydrogenase (short-subunit alcohol dehydrogenase family)
MKLEKKVAIVTGGGQGIGRAVCLSLAREGSDVMVTDIVSQTAKGVSEEIQAMGRHSLSFEMDVSNGNQVKEMVKTALAAFGRIDVLVNVAGIFIKSPIEEVSEQDWDRVITVNLKGTFLCSQAVGKEMIKKGGGTIVNFASVAGHTPQIYSGAYSPSKAGVILLTKIMAVEWAKYNIRVNAVSPGPITTPMTDSVYNTEKLRKGRAKAIPLNRFGNPEEVAKAVVFLASDDASYITGHALAIDGGSLNSVFYLTGLISTYQ